MQPCATGTVLSDTLFLLTHRYIGYYVRLEEGEPPKHFYDHQQTHWNSQDWLKHYLDEHRKKSIPFH